MPDVIQTKITKVSNTPNLNEQIKEAITLLINNEVVAFPTETVYGLGANALDENAVKKIFLAKGRPSDNPIIVHVANFQMLEKLADLTKIKDTVTKLSQDFWPGPLTLIVPKSDLVPFITTGGLSTIAIRIPNHFLALKLIELSNIPIAAPSANLSGKPSPTTAQDVYEDMNGRISLILDGGETEIGLESTVLDISNPNDVPTIFRPGKITQFEIESCLGIKIKIFDNSISKEDKLLAPISPGLKYRHYAPNAEMIIVDNEVEFLHTFQESKKNFERIGVIANTKTAQTIKKSKLESQIELLFIYNSSEDLGSKLYSKLREMDSINIKLIIVQFNDSFDFGLAIRNRLLKASTKK
jgi:L-threonylcarbamoyladenylate synthase